MQGDGEGEEINSGSDLFDRSEFDMIYILFPEFFKLLKNANSADADGKHNGCLLLDQNFPAVKVKRFNWYTSQERDQKGRVEKINGPI